MSNNQITQVHSISPEEFKNEIIAGVKKSLKEFGKTFKPAEEEVWLTRNQLKEMLSVSLTTIHNWCNEGILTPYKIGCQTRFKKRDILEILENSNSKALKNQVAR